MSNVNIFVAAHKTGWPDLPQGYTVIQVGAALQDHLPHAGAWDDAGENISKKNRNYCELTALWWIAHHAKEEILGLAHYRRLFSFAPCRNPFLEQYHWTPDDPRLVDALRTKNVPAMLDGCDMLLPYAQYFKETVAGQYRIHHRADDLSAMVAAFDHLHPKERDVLRRSLQGCREYGYNMFIARRELFCAYADWLFEILEDVEAQITISDDPYQARVFGFLSERLMNVFVETHHLRVRTLPLIFLEDHPLSSWQRKSGHTILADIGILPWMPRCLASSGGHHISRLS